MSKRLTVTLRAWLSVCQKHVAIELPYKTLHWIYIYLLTPRPYH